MTISVIVELPEEMEQFAPDLRFFVDVMVRKLHLNRHKGYAENVTIGHMIQRCRAELAEMEEAYKEQDQFSVAVEAADVANFAFLASLVTMRMTREEFNRSRHDKRI